MKNLKTIIAILCLIAIMLQLIGCSQPISVKQYLRTLNENAGVSPIALFSYKLGESKNNIYRFRENEYPVAQYPSAIYNELVYIVKYRDAYANHMEIGIYNSNGEMVENVDLGVFNTQENDSYAYQEWCSFYSEWYHNPAMHDREVNFQYHHSIYQNSVTSRYSNGCIYVKDVDHCLKYDIKNGTLTENPEEAKDIFTLHYTYRTSEDNQSLLIRRVEDGTVKEVTYESIAKTCSEIQEIINLYGNRNVFLGGIIPSHIAANYTGTPFLRTTGRSSLLHETDGELYVSIHLRNYWGNFFPIILKMNFDTEEFTFCVAGEEWRTILYAIPVFN